MSGLLIQIKRISLYNCTPIILILGTTVLNILKTCVKFHTNLTYFSAIFINIIRLHIENLPDREITAAVPQPPHSSKVGSSSTGIRRSSTSSPIPAPTAADSCWMIEGNTEEDFGVIYLPSLIPKKLQAPHSSMYLCSAASRYMIFE